MTAPSLFRDGPFRAGRAHLPMLMRDAGGFMAAFLVFYFLS